MQAEPDGYIDLWSREHYKDLCIDTPVKTLNRGWVRHGDLVPGDDVFSPDGCAVRVQAATEHYQDSECYEITFSDGARLIAGAGHLWDIRNKHKHRQSGTDIRRVAFSHEQINTEEMFRRVNSGKRVDVGVAKPLDGHNHDIGIDPYTLGVWLADGSSDAGVITFNSEDHFIQDRIKSAGYELSQNHTRKDDKKSGSEKRTVYGLVKALRKLELAGEKRIPQHCKFASKENRHALLQGLMDGDGHCNYRGTATYVTKLGALAHDVYDLAASLGMRPRIRRHKHKSGEFEGYSYYQVSFQAKLRLNPFSLPRKAKHAIPDSHYDGCRTVYSVERIPSVPTNCIQVEGGRYLVGRELIPTHNSTVLTFAGLIFKIINNPEITIGIFSHTKPIAKAFLRQIKMELEGNEVLKELYPDIFWQHPRKDAPKWTEDQGIIVKRKSNPKESTVEAHGLVDGQPTSRHFKHLHYDDVVTLESVTSPDMIQKTTAAFEMSDNLGSEGGTWSIVGTIYHFGDTYRQLIKRGYKARIYPCTKDGTENFTADNCVLMKPETLKAKRMKQGPMTFGTQMMLNPRGDDSMTFRREWIKWFTNELTPEEALKMNRYIFVDPANDKRKHNDWTTFWVVGLDSNNNYICLDVVRDKLNLAERARTLFDLHDLWKPLAVFYEKYGMQADVQHMESEMQRVNYRFQIHEVGGNTPKLDRIKRLIPPFEQGRIHMRRTKQYTDYEGNTTNLIETFVETEYCAFPVMEHDDMIDCLARIEDPLVQKFLKWPARQRTGPVQVITDRAPKRNNFRAGPQVITVR